MAMKKNTDNGSQSLRTRLMRWLDRVTGTFIAKLIFNVIFSILRLFLARPFAIVVAVLQGLYNLAKAAGESWKKKRNPDNDTTDEDEDLPQPDEDDAASDFKAETDPAPEESNNATTSAVETPV